MLLCRRSCRESLRCNLAAELRTSCSMFRQHWEPPSNGTHQTILFKGVSFLNAPCQSAEWSFSVKLVSRAHGLNCSLIALIVLVLIIALVMRKAVTRRSAPMLLQGRTGKPKPCLRGWDSFWVLWNTAKSLKTIKKIMAVAPKPVPKWLARVSGNMETKTCGLPLQSFHFEPHPDTLRKRWFRPWPSC